MRHEIFYQVKILKNLGLLL